MRQSEDEELQTKSELTVGAPGDRYEREADSVADRVMAMPDAALQRQELEDEEAPEIESQVEEEPEVQGQVDDEDESVQAKGEMVPVVTPQMKSELNSSRGGGELLSGEVRSFMEPRFGRDFSNVRVHTGSRTTSLAKGLRAQAFTRGSDVYFGSGKYAPNTSSGKRLVAHELAHTVQQGRNNLIQRQKREDKNLVSPRFAGDEYLEACLDGKYFIGRGNQGPAVAKIQQALLDSGFSLLKQGVDGTFGPETERALIEFQQAAGLKGGNVDGVVGPRTMNLLDRDTGNILPTVGIKPKVGRFENLDVEVRVEITKVTDGTLISVYVTDYTYPPGVDPRVDDVDKTYVYLDGRNPKHDEEKYVGIRSGLKHPVVEIFIPDDLAREVTMPSANKIAESFVKRERIKRTGIVDKIQDYKDIVDLALVVAKNPRVSEHIRTYVRMAQKYGKGLNYILAAYEVYEATSQGGARAGGKEAVVQSGKLAGAWLGAKIFGSLAITPCTMAAIGAPLCIGIVSFIGGIICAYLGETAMKALVNYEAPKSMTIGEMVGGGWTVPPEAIEWYEYEKKLWEEFLKFLEKVSNNVGKEDENLIKDLEIGNLVMEFTKPPVIVSLRILEEEGYRPKVSSPIGEDSYPRHYLEPAKPRTEYQKRLGKLFDEWNKAPEGAKRYYEKIILEYWQDFHSSGIVQHSIYFTRAMSKLAMFYNKGKGKE